MLGLIRWSIAHRRWVVVTWVVVAVLASVLAQSVGRHYATNFSLPGTESQRASDLLTQEFAAQSGDVDTIVFHVSHGSVDSPAVRAAIAPLLARASTFPHVAGLVSPYTPRGAVQVSPNRMTAFATINYDKRANLLPNSTGRPILAAIKAIHVPGLQVAAGGPVVEQAEGFSIGPATAVGVIAALIILLLTFGSLTAAGMPLITAGLGLITGVALIGLTTHLTSMSNVAPQLALMIGLGVGIDYALFIVTRFSENYPALGDVQRSVIEAMDTSGRAILLAGATVVIALLGMFATGVSFMYGLAIASVIAVLLTLAASLTLLPALLSRFGARLVRPHGARRGLLGRWRAGGSRLQGRGAVLAAPTRSAWRRWSETVQQRPWPLAIVSLAVMVALLLPVSRFALNNSDAGNSPANLSSRHAFDSARPGLGPGFNGPLTLVAELRDRGQTTGLSAVRAATAATPDVVAVTQPRIGPSGTVAVMQVYPGSAPQALATTSLVNKLRHQVLPPLEQHAGVHVLVGGFTAGSIDFSHVLSSKLPLFIAIVVGLSALLLFVIFRSVVIPLQAAIMNLLSIGGALGVTVAIFQWGWLGGVVGVQPGPIEPWIPVLMFAVVFGLSMDYEVFLISRVREEWVRGRDPSAAVADGISSHRTRDQRGRRDHDLRVPVLHARGPAHDQGVRLRPRRGRVPRRARGALRVAAGGAGAAGHDYVASTALARRSATPHQHRGFVRPRAAPAGSVPAQWSRRAGACSCGGVSGEWEQDVEDLDRLAASDPSGLCQRSRFDDAAGMRAGGGQVPLCAASRRARGQSPGFRPREGIYAQPTLRPGKRGRQNDPRGRRSETPACPPRNNLLPFDERFEVVESFFETLGVHALNDERISDLAEHAARQRIVERRGQACSIAFRGELPASAPRQHALHLEKLQLARLVVENRLGDRHGHAGRLHLEGDLAPFFGEGSGDVDLRHARIPVRPATGIAQERHGLLRRGLDLDIALHDRHRGSPRSLVSSRSLTRLGQSAAAGPGRTIAEPPALSTDRPFSESSSATALFAPLT